VIGDPSSATVTTQYQSAAGRFGARYLVRDTRELSLEAAGGFVIVPALTLVLGFPMRMAVSTSLLIIALVAVGGLVGHLQTGQVDWPLIGLLLLGSAIGMTGGSWGAQQVSQATLAKGFAAIAILVAIVMIIHNGMKLVGGSV